MSPVRHATKIGGIFAAGRQGGMAFCHALAGRDAARQDLEGRGPHFPRAARKATTRHPATGSGHGAGL